MDDEILHGHLQHHWAAAAAGITLFDRISRIIRHQNTQGVVSEMAIEIRHDRESLRRIMNAVGAKPSRPATASAALGGRLARITPGGRWVGRTLLTDILDTEALRAAVSGKRAGWELLRVRAEHDHRIDADLLDDLLRRADSQLTRLTDLHATLAAL